MRDEIAEVYESTSARASPGTEAAADGSERGNGAYRLHNELRPHQAVGAVLQELLNGVLVLVPGHRSRLTAEKSQRRQMVKCFSLPS